MGLGKWIKRAAAPFGLGLLDEDTLAGVPVIGGLVGAQSDEEKNLLKKQEEMAREAAKRQEQNAQMRMQALGQSLLAFAPRNQMMAQMFGPQAAFSPEQMHAMSADPRGAPQADPVTAKMMERYPNLHKADYGFVRDEKLATSEQFGKVLDHQRALEEYERKEKERLAALQAFNTKGAGPAPLARRPAPAGARRF